MVVALSWSSLAACGYHPLAASRFITQLITRASACVQVSGQPHLTPAIAGLTAAAPGSFVNASWADVFSDGESGIATFEVCLAVLPDACTTWRPVGAAFSYTHELAASFTSPTQQLVAYTRSYDGAGHTSVSFSDPLLLDAAPPVLSRLSVLSFEAKPVSPQPCILTSTVAVLVQWDGSDEGAGLSSFHVSVARRPATGGGISFTQELLSTQRDAVSREAALSVSAEDGTTLQYAVVAADAAGLLSLPMAIECLVDRSPPDPVLVWAESERSQVATIGVGLFAVAASSSSTPSACFSFADAHTDIVSFALATTRVRDDDGKRAKAIGVSNSKAAAHAQLLSKASSADRRCAPLPAIAAKEAVLIEVAATNAAGLQSDWARATLIVDDSPPEAAVVTAHTGTLSPSHLASACCLALSWEHWIDRETPVANYDVCFDSYGCSDCL